MKEKERIGFCSKTHTLTTLGTGFVVQLRDAKQVCICCSLARIDHIYFSSIREEMGGSFAMLARLTLSYHQAMRLDLNPPIGSKGNLLNVKIPEDHEECKGESKSIENMVKVHCRGIDQQGFGEKIGPLLLLFTIGNQEGPLVG